MEQRTKKILTIASWTTAGIASAAILLWPSANHASAITTPQMNAVMRQPVAPMTCADWQQMATVIEQHYGWLAFGLIAAAMGVFRMVDIAIGTVELAMRGLTYIGKFSYYGARYGRKEAMERIRF